MEKKTQAQEAVNEFKKSDIIPSRGQRILDAFGPGRVHVFSDGSVAVHWDDGVFDVGEVIEDDEK